MWDKDRDDGVPYTSFGTGTGMMDFMHVPWEKTRDRNWDKYSGYKS